MDQRSLRARLRRIPRGAIRAMRAFGLRYLLALLRPPGAFGTRSVRLPWGRFHFRTLDSDAETYSQVFRGGEYDLAQAPQGAAVRARYDALLAEGRTPVIIDCGANIGAATLWFALRFPGATVCAVEPDAESARVCALNIAQRPNARLIAAAIGSRPGAVTLRRYEYAWSSTTARADDGDIPVVTIGEILEAVPRGSLLIVKIDIEGFERDLFACDTGWIDEAAAVIVEPHDWKLPGQRTSLSMQRALMGRGEMVLSGENLIFFAPDLASGGGEPGRRTDHRAPAVPLPG